MAELSQALELDTSTNLGSAKTAVEGLCGHLCTVDEGSGLVELVHPTVREFLLSEAAGDFFISKADANHRIAITCLELLSSDKLQPPRNRRQLARRRERGHTPLLQYAATQFSEHIYTARTESDELLIAPHRFLTTNTLSWIEYVAQSGDLYPIIRVSKNLKSYLVRPAKCKSPLNSQVRDVENWATDLSRLATRFGESLMQSPSSIYYIMPPLCSTSSAISRHAANRLDGLSIPGYRESVWGDCTAAVSFEDGKTAAAISCGERLIGVGMESGDIDLYDIRSCQREGILQLQKHPIDLTHFSDRLIVIPKTRTVAALDRALVEDHVFHYQSPEDEVHDAPRLKAPDVASLSPDMGMLALGYRWGTICLWEVQTNDFVKSVRVSDPNIVPVLLFNPNPSIGLLLVVYKQRELVLYETSNGDLVKRQLTSGESGIISVTCSPDGRTLASTDTHGTLQVWDFESLDLLRQVATPAASFRTLQFASDGSSVIDMMDTGVRI
ncbi:uncharacterized protein PG986_012719 [Apiospora aurea]|uniref:GPI inositol-deacylase winged helix domain-containing protein n=1 Tax=Apiospora aurea TaxID=335848 RepID=A0ABR1Q0S6_9PEZI